MSINLEATKCCPGTTLFHGLDSLSLRFRVSMCLSPFLQTFPEDILYTEPYPIFLSPSNTDFSISLATPAPLSCCSTSLFSLCLLISLIFLFFCLSLSEYVYVFQVSLSLCFSHSPSLPPHVHPKHVFLSRPALSLGTSLHPSSHMSLTTIVSIGSAGPPWASHYSAFYFLSLFYSHCLCHPLSRTPLFG